MKYTEHDIDFLLSPNAIRDRATKILAMCKSGGTNFAFHPEKLGSVADYVLSVMNANYPDGRIPFHARDTHINAGAVARIARLEQLLCDTSERARAKIELIVCSVLLDAGAGDSWRYNEAAKVYSRSEGLGVASFHMFMDGAFSSYRKLEADSIGLKTVSAKDLEAYFQVNPNNPLLGVDGRVFLLNSLGRVIQENPKIFPSGRLGEMWDYFLGTYGKKKWRAVDILSFVLRVFAPIWPSRISLGEQSLGDVWRYRPLGSFDSVDSLVPFHKLSQWLTYSLLVPMIEGGIEIEGVDDLTGLAEYRNGGLLIDAGLISLRNPSLASVEHEPASELIIEWRALTVALLDEIAKAIREKLGKSATDLPLVKVLEGGTWHAGRRLAREMRPETSAPPLKIRSDGTVF